jgi:iron complex transport system ATP-binding protein
VIHADRVRVVRGDRAVLDDVRFDAEEGAIAAILGPNGAGKSTLLKTLAGILAHEGTVMLDGRPIGAWSARERARRMAYVPQRSELTAALHVETVIAQGRYAHTGGLGQPGAADRRAIAAAMERTDVLGLAKRRFDQLSIGERRRVLLARALATEARAILLDEPTEALDVRHALELHGLLRELADDGYCVVAVLHGLDAARQRTDRATLLSEGRVVADGPSVEVVTSEHVRAVYGVELVERGSLGFLLGAGSGGEA